MADVVTWTFTAGDGYRWHYRHFPPGGKPKATVVGIHGIQSHGGWYEGSSRYLRDAGFDVYFLDRRGSGLNDVARGDTPSFRRLLDDLAEFLKTRRGPGQPPLFLSAISWGGKLGAGINYRYPGIIDGLILLAPGFCPQVRTSGKERWAIAQASLLDPTRAFPIPLNDPALFTTTPYWQKFIEADPLSLHDATARFLVESIKFDVYLKRVPAHVKAPVLLLLAGQDRIIDNQRTRNYVARFASPDKTVVEFATAHHTLEFEPDPQPIFAGMTEWLLGRSA